MNPSDQSILTILAAMDAVWFPARYSRDKEQLNLYTNKREARRHYRTRGVAVHGGGGSGERQQFHRAIKAAVDAGHAETMPGTTRAVRAKLTTAGEARARALVGQPSIADSIAGLRRIKKFAPAGTWVCEYLLAGIDFGHKDARIILLGYEDTMVPALVRGWVEAHSTTSGYLAYRLTESWKSAALPSDHPKSGDLPECSDAAINIYSSALRDALGRLQHADPGNIVGLHPLTPGEIVFKRGDKVDE